MTAIDGNGGNDPLSGQEIIVEPGTYTLTATLAPTVDHLDVHGVDGEPRPLIQGNGIELLHPNAFNEEFAYLAFDAEGSFNDGILMDGGVLDRLLVEGTPGGNLCQCYGGILRDSVLVASGSSGGSAWGLDSNGGSATEILRNDTLIATSALGYALIMSQGGTPTSPTTIDARNVIAINTAGGTDVASYGPMATVDISNSDFTSPQTGGGGAIADGGGNITAAPQFIDQSTGDYRELPSSPTIDAGTDDTSNDGTLDYGGAPRLAGAHTDIGAYEYQPPAHVTITAGQGQTATVGTVFGQGLSVTVTDAQGNPVPDTPVTFTAPSTGSSAAFNGSASAPVTAGVDGVAAVPAPTAGTVAGAYNLTATAGAATALISMRNSPGAVASLKLTPQSASVLAATTVTYAVEAYDKYGNDAGPAGSGVALAVTPDGGCAALSCTALAPGAHTVTATLGSASGSTSLQVLPLAPGLALVHHSVRIAHRGRSGELAARCTAPLGEVCSVSGKLTARSHGHVVVYGSVAGRLTATRTGQLKITLSPAASRKLSSRGVRVSLRLSVSDLSGRASIPAAVTLVRSAR